MEKKTSKKENKLLHLILIRVLLFFVRHLWVFFFNYCTGWTAYICLNIAVCIDRTWYTQKMKKWPLWPVLPYIVQTNGMQDEYKKGSSLLYLLNFFAFTPSFILNWKIFCFTLLFLRVQDLLNIQVYLFAMPMMNLLQFKSRP